MSLISNKKNKDSEKGFSILEVAVSIGIVSTVLVAIMALFAYDLRLEINNRKKIIASYLAQEALEIVKQKRDTNWFSDAPDWMDGINYGPNMILSAIDTSDLTKGWTINSSTGPLDEPAKKIYIYCSHYVQNSTGNPGPGAIDTGFRRYMDIKNYNSDGGDGSEVTVYVYYNNGANVVTVHSYMYDDWLK